MTDLQQGGNAPVPADALTIAFAWAPAAGRDIDADTSAYLLTADGKVRSDADMVFYNQPQGGDGSVRVVPGSGRGAFEVDVSRLPAEIERVVFCVTIHEAQAKGQTLALLDGAGLTVAPSGGATSLTFRPDLVGASETAMTFGELYRRNGQWKFRAVGQGFAGGLAPLARSFGIDVAEDAPAAPTPPPAGPRPT